MGASVGVQEPDSPLMKMYGQNVAFAKAHHFAPPPPMKGILVAPFDKPSVAVKVLGPQLSALSRDAGMPYTQDVQLTEVKDVPNQLPGGKAETIDSLATLVDGEAHVKMRNVERSESAPAGPGGWMLFVGLSIGAEEDRFGADSVSMLGVIKSIKPNQKVLNEIFEQRLEANREANEEQRKAARDRFEAGQKAHEDQLKGYDQYNKKLARPGGGQGQVGQGFHRIRPRLPHRRRQPDRQDGRRRSEQRQTDDGRPEQGRPGAVQRDPAAGSVNQLL